MRERPVLLPIVAAIVAQHKLAELAELFDRIDIPFAPVAKPGDLFDDPQLNAGGRMLDVDFAGGVRAKIPRLPIEIGDHDLALRRQPPAIGEHTAEILAELGLAPAEIDALASTRASSRSAEPTNERFADRRAHQRRRPARRLSDREGRRSRPRARSH